VRAPATLLVVALLVAGCRAPAQPAPSVREGALRYVALGDSYTIGTSVSESERWPNQLVERVGGGRLALVANLGVNGYTSADLIADELPRLDGLSPEFVTLLVGVNDVVQGVPEPGYADNVATILDDLLARLPPDRILAVATPDYTATPQGSAYGEPHAQREAIARANEILRAACEERGVGFVPDVFEMSQEAAHDRSLVADDGLHPSGKQYERWVDAIAPVVEELLRP
jgi:acyl-CoA thioesterase-1